MKITIVTIGDELLIGQVIDTNSAWIGSQSNKRGFEVQRILSVSDEYSEIQSALRIALEESEIIILTGGLGPTKDDISKKAIAEFLGDRLEHSERSWTHIQSMFRKFGRKPLDMHREQALMPTKAVLLENPMGTAMGMWMEQGTKVIVSLPGVPYEMKNIMSEEVFPRLVDRYPGLHSVEHRTLHTVGVGEGTLAELLEEYETRLPSNIKLAFLPNLGKVRLRLTQSGGQLENVPAIDELKEGMKKILGTRVFGEGDTSLEKEIGALLMAKKLQMGTAESCSGGFISHRITAVPGSSAYFQGSVVSYSNAIKQSVLQVQEKTLQKHGAVSEEVVREMVNGGIKVLNCDLVIAISGVAGPGGGSKEKPVGTVWIAVGNKDKTETCLLNVSKDRLKNIEYSSTRALGLLRSFVLENY